MRAIVVTPHKEDSLRLVDTKEPERAASAVLAEVLHVGICGTDREIVDGKYGWAPAGREDLVIGHESLARVLKAPRGAAVRRGDLIVGIVRRPDPVPCACCAIGEWDMCRNGEYTEHGIKQCDGFAAERICVEAAFVIRTDPALGVAGVLTEPASIVAKAWEEVDRVGPRFAAWSPRRVLITGAGPVGLLAALLARQRGFDVHVLDHAVDGPKPGLVRDLGAHFHGPDVDAIDDLAPDIVIECTGANAVVLRAVKALGPNGVLCLAGVSSGGHTINLDVGGIDRSLVLENQLVLGSVNANRRHYQRAVDALSRANRSWLLRIISRRVPMERWREAFEKRPRDVKVVIDFPAAASTHS